MKISNARWLIETRDLDDDIFGLNSKEHKQERQRRVDIFAPARRQANFTSPGRRFAEDLPLYGRPVLSVNRWETVNQVPHLEPGHARVLSGSTVVNSNGSQGGMPSPQPATPPRILLEPVQGRTKERSENRPREDTEETGVLISIDAISPDVQWESISDSIQTSHENELADLRDEHAAEIHELRDKEWRPSSAS